MRFAEHFNYMWWAYAVIFVMICLSAYFSASEIAFNTANKLRLKKAAEGGIVGEWAPTLKKALAMARSKGKLTLACGSLYLYKDL